MSKQAEFKLAGTQYDGRRSHLTDQDRADIKSFFDAGMTKYELAKMFDVSRDTIRWIVEPNRPKRKSQWYKYYNPQKRKEYRMKYEDKQRMMRTVERMAERTKGKKLFAQA